MILLHSSDLHGDWDDLLVALETLDFDVWVDTGDTHKNRVKSPLDNRVVGSVGVETPFQRKLFEDYSKMPRKIAKALGSRPCVFQPGNHCYYDMGGALRDRGVNVFRPKPYEAFELLGYTWSGFRDIPWIKGDWNFECQDLTHLIEASLSLQPDVWVTHANPLMPGDSGYGCEQMLRSLDTMEQPPTLHLFGHSHRTGGEMWLRGGTLHVNGARNVRLLEV